MTSRYTEAHANIFTHAALEVHVDLYAHACYRPLLISSVTTQHLDGYTFCNSLLYYTVATIKQYVIRKPTHI